MPEGSEGNRPAGMDTWIRRRKTYIVDRQMQYTYIAMVVGMVMVMLLGIVLSNAVMIWLYNRVLELQYNITPNWRKDLWVYVAADSAIIIVLVISAIFYSVLHSHRVAGPIYRLKQTLIRMQTGDYDFVVTFRQKDLLKDVADEANRLLGDLQNRREELRKLRTRVEEVGKRLKGMEGAADHVTELEEIGAQLNHLIVSKDPPLPAPLATGAQMPAPSQTPVSAPPAT